MISSPACGVHRPFFVGFSFKDWLGLSQRLMPPRTVNLLVAFSLSSYRMECCGETFFGGPSNDRDKHLPSKINRAALLAFWILLHLLLLLPAGLIRNALLPFNGHTFPFIRPHKILHFSASSCNGRQSVSPDGLWGLKGK